MSNPYRHPISTPVPELIGKFSIADSPSAPVPPPSADAAMVEAYTVLVANIIDPDTARYIAGQDEDRQPLLRKNWTAMERARSVLAALDLASRQPVGVPEGFVLVPREPTQEMVDNAFDFDTPENARRRIWQIMIAAAPATDAGEGK